MKKAEIILLILWISIGALSRILPHLPNVTALASLSLLAGMQFSKTRSLLLVIATLFLSDLILAYGWGYAVLGSWSLFTYSGFAFIALLGSKFQTTKGLRLFGLLISASLLFWMWTNFGVWLCSGLYPHAADGFLACYIAALPFLRNECLGDLGWMLVLLGILKYFPGLRCASPRLHTAI
jgi:hypothetical protein